MLLIYFLKAGLRSRLVRQQGEHREATDYHLCSVSSYWISALCPVFFRLPCVLTGAEVNRKQIHNVAHLLWELSYSQKLDVTPHFLLPLASFPCGPKCVQVTKLHSWYEREYKEVKDTAVSFLTFHNPDLWLFLWTPNNFWIVTNIMSTFKRSVASTEGI